MTVSVDLKRKDNEFVYLEWSRAEVLSCTDSDILVCSK